mmetsp:Transcript_24617/g.43898  ORF Transcript_24617/g.43898 Transcript_24617/m.43898 type:complete len:106 (-) Transcript_24617:334-651(-)
MFRRQQPPKASLPCLRNQRRARRKESGCGCLHLAIMAVLHHMPCNQMLVKHGFALQFFILHKQLPGNSLSFAPELDYILQHQQQRPGSGVAASIVARCHCCDARG